jgi:hypothetical protein
MLTSVFVGCSITAGSGFEDFKDSNSLWVNLLAKNIPALKETKVINAGVPGISNDKIFHNAVKEITKHQPKYAFVQWTSYPRYEFSLGVETYSTSQYFTPNSIVSEHRLHKENYSANYIKDIRDRFLSLHHPHYGIVQLIEFVNTLIKLCTVTGTKIFFVNGLCPWDNEYFVKLDNVLPSSYTQYTQEILDAGTRDDGEVFKLYDKIHSEYQQAGSVQQPHWLNLYKSFRDHKVDTNSDNKHPGIKSNQIYFDFLKESLVNHL